MVPQTLALPPQLLISLILRFIDGFLGAFFDDSGGRLIVPSVPTVATR
jgi:hypothetical protein